jgi:DNA invertase Pin-like site-specific DNA recombinase
LIVESLDRLSRDQIRPALQLFLALQDYGIVIVTLQPEREYAPNDADALALIEPLIVFARAHEESAMKSLRRRDGWRQARERARAGGGPMLKTCPAWLEVRKDGFRAKPHAVAAVRRIFALACDGLGVHRITQRLTSDNVRPIGTSNRWVKAYVHRILTNPAAMGSYQPHKQNGKGVIPDGSPISGYYPAVVTAEEWQQAQAALQARGGDFDANGRFRRGGNGVRGAGRKGKGEPNLFTGLVYCALSGEKMHLVHALGRKLADERKRKKYVYLAPTQETGASKGGRIDYAVFEAAILTLLAELHPRDIMAGERSVAGKSELARLSGRLFDIDNRIAQARRRALSAGDFDALLDLIQDLQDERKQVMERRAELELKERGRGSANLGEAQSLIGMLKSSPIRQREELRRRLRVRIEQLVSRIWLVIVRQRAVAICAAQLVFRGGDRRRDYVIVHRPGTRYCARSWWARSMIAGVGPKKLNLGDQSQAKKLETTLKMMELGDRKHG